MTVSLSYSKAIKAVLKVAHCLGEAESFFPALVYYCDRVAAEEDGRSLIDARVNRPGL